ncbi:hypothetical protein FRB91_001903 [Serendipita sp. 411]|nr:hypothetical protein FRC16_004658 [Serendipita sp. 398]KAG8811478.1 hypothetical protein FRC18_003453 [Serendipita sp. 400]KAG8845276.1 hypothetical protein FRB91_001903 [Serendipita sp. 411]KAG8847551.1 hypothetical protein FRC20_002739 [Serendipita sp. 405]
MQQLFLRGSPLSELTVLKSDGTVVFVVETHPYLDDQRTEIYDSDGEVLGSILWNGTQPSHICVYSESATHMQPFEMVPRGDPTTSDHFEVVAGDGMHEMLWLVDRRGLRAHYPMYSRTSTQMPPVVAEFVPRRSSTKLDAGKRKLSEMDCDTLHLAIDQLSDDALGRFWVAFVLLDIIRKSKFHIPDEVLARLQNQNVLAAPARGSSRDSAVASGSQSAHPNGKSSSSGSKRNGWRSKSGTDRLKDLTIGLMLQPRRWSL